MTEQIHDPLCPQQPRADGATLVMRNGKVVYCGCDLIAEVIGAAVQRVEAIADDPNSGVDWHWDYEADPTGMTRNPRVWIREAVAAIKNEAQ